MRYFIVIFITSLLILNTHNAWAAKLAIVIDDFGYRQHNEEQIIGLSPFITISVLPHSPNARRIATLAHKHGNDVIIHLPMAPISKQRLEKDTLFPSMSESQVKTIVDNAIVRVPYAIGVNNHMGSLMTSNLPGMINVMKALSGYSLFFLDSKTIGKTQVKKAAAGYNIAVLTRDVFLDDTQTESSISQQFDLAVKLARKNGVAIVIGHPHPQTVNVLKAKLASLPADIKLTRLSELTIPISERPKMTLKEIVEKCKHQFEAVTNLKLIEE